MLLLGDPGTGKSQIMHQLIDEIVSRKRFEAIVVYDPVGEFLEQHYDPDTDVILNPLDARCPYWNPVDEIENVTDEISAPERYFIAESFFPDHPHASPTTQFFVKAVQHFCAYARLQTIAGAAGGNAYRRSTDRPVCRRHGTRASDRQGCQSAACRSARHGFDAFTIAALMGHSQIQTTARYVRATERNKRAAVDAVMLNSDGGHKLDTTQKRPGALAAVTY